MSKESPCKPFLGRLNIRGDKVLQVIGTLSIGEKSKTALAKILFSNVNILVLDEPTNHVELSAREALEDALDDNDGTVIIASHDRYLLDRVATEIAQEIRVLLQDDNVDARTPQQEAEHHPSRTAPGDDAGGVEGRRVHSAPCSASS